MSTDALADNVRRVEKLEGAQRLRDPWCQALLAQIGAKRLLGSKEVGLPKNMRQMAYIAMVLQCLRDDDPAGTAHLSLSPTQATSIGRKAVGLRTELRKTGKSSAIGVDENFESTLDELCDIRFAVSGPVRSLKGNPERRLFIWSVAEACVKAFGFFHPEAIAEIVAMRWDEIDDRSVRRELNKQRRSAIETRAKAFLKVEADSRVESTLAIGRASSFSLGSRAIASSLNQQLASVRNALLALTDEGTRNFLVARFDQSLADYDFMVENGRARNHLFELSRPDA